VLHVTSTARSTDTTVTIVGPHAFSPSSVTIRAGGKVTWTWMASGHSVTSGTP